MTKGLGGRYEIMEVSFKPYSCCRWIHPAIDAAIQLVERHKIDLGKIEKITVKSFNQGIRQYQHSRRTPKNEIEAQFSGPYCIAVSIAGIEPGPEWFTKENVKNHKILGIAKKIKFKPDPDAEKAFPIMKTATVEIAVGKRKYSNHVDYPKGDPRNPLTQIELETKFMNLATSVINVDKATKAKAIISKLEKTDNLTRLMKLLHC